MSDVIFGSFFSFCLDRLAASSCVSEERLPLSLPILEDGRLYTVAFLFVFLFRFLFLVSVVTPMMPCCFFFLNKIPTYRAFHDSNFCCRVYFTRPFVCSMSVVVQYSRWQGANTLKVFSTKILGYRTQHRCPTPYNTETKAICPLVQEIGGARQIRLPNAWRRTQENHKLFYAIPSEI